MLSILQRLKPVRDRVSSLVTPDTTQRWHRELARSEWTTVIGSCREGGSLTICDVSSGGGPARTRAGLLPPEGRAQEGRYRDLDCDHSTNPGREESTSSTG